MRGQVLTATAVGLTVLATAGLLSLAVGARAIAPADVLDALLHGGHTQEAAIVTDVRVPRTLLGIAVGAALGIGGALMQGLTRNPLADPGLLGVNAGAAAAVVLAFALGLAGGAGAVWCAMLGAGIASAAVYAIGSAGRGGATPVRLALAGTAITAALTAVVSGVVLADEQLVQQYRAWLVGALGGRGRDELSTILPFLLAGGVLSAVLARPLNAIALGEDQARALGARVGATRVGAAAAVALLCGAATAAVGPILFLGLTVPHAARAIAGPDQRWLLALSALLGAALLLLADVAGRVLASPGEVQAGVMVTVVGAPVFILLVRRARIAAL